MIMIYIITQYAIRLPVNIVLKKGKMAVSFHLPLFLYILVVWPRCSLLIVGFLLHLLFEPEDGAR
jgi:hypothetical protein